MTFATAPRLVGPATSHFFFTHLLCRKQTCFLSLFQIGLASRTSRSQYFASNFVLITTLLNLAHTSTDASAMAAPIAALTPELPPTHGGQLLRDFVAAFDCVQEQLQKGGTQAVVPLTDISLLGSEGVGILKKHLE